MKKIYKVLLLIVFISCNKTNKNVIKDSKTEIVKLPPPTIKINEDNLVGFTCYYSGRKSKPVENITKIIDDQNYIVLKEKLFSSKPAEKYLATFICLKLFKKNIILLNNRELFQIQQNKISTEKIYFCGGCTESENYNMSQLFSQNVEISNEVENWYKKLTKK